MTPLALAAWFMDDGGADYAGLNIHTHNFTLSEVFSLLDVLDGKFGLEVNERANKGKWIIYIQQASVDDFSEIVKPYILPSLHYKLVPRNRRTP